MNTEESILILAAVAAVAYWYGKKQAVTQATSQAAQDADPLAWLGGWIQR